MRDLRARPVTAIVVGGAVAGALDLASAILAWLPRGVPPVRILQSIASGLYGRAAARGGWETALVGLACHFLIAFTAATIYVLAARRLRVLTDRAVVAGLLYGELVYLFMNFVVVPLSAIGHGPRMSWQHLITGPIAHPFVVGLPIALAARHFAGRRAA